MTRSAGTKKARYGGNYEPDGRCCIRGCGDPLWGHEFCRSHYQAWRQNGHPLYMLKKGARRATEAKSSMREYKSWWAAKSRCFNPKVAQYPNYGGRGITMCKPWLDSFETFLADMGRAPQGMTLERNDVHGNYEPGNCRWASIRDQNRNTRATVLTAEKVAIGKARSLRGESTASIARDLGVSRYALYQALAGTSWKEVEPAGSA